MKLKVLFVLVTTSLTDFATCTKSSPRASSWQFPVYQATSESRIGRQMPPHPEPDAVLINVDKSGKRQPSDGEGYPGFPAGGPGIFGIPGFGFPGFGRGPEVDNRPDIFGNPGVLGIPRLPGFPNTFGMPGFHTISTNMGDPSVYGGAPGVFLSPRGPDSPLMSPNPSLYGIRVHQNGPGLTTVRTGVFGTPGDSLQPRDQSEFGRDIFAVAGSGNFPYHFPGFFFPRRNPNVPNHGFPTNRGRMPESEGKLPDAHYPSEGPRFPHQTRDSDGHFPRKEFHEGPGGRETYDDPTANMFPLMNAPTPVFESA